MSHAYYNAQWQSALESLNTCLDLENPSVSVNPDSKKPLNEKTLSWDEAFQHFATLYIKYLGIYRQLEECYDQIVHPQKRRDLKLLLECVMARFTQVKGQCAKFGFKGRANDMLNLENYMRDLQRCDISAALEVPIPRYFKEKSDNDDSNKKRDVFEKCLEEHGMMNGVDETSFQYVAKLTKEQAIRVIQKNERGRQGAARAKLMKELKDEDMMRKKLSLNGSVERDPTTAATMIQKMFRGYLCRIKVQRATQEELVFLGMKAVNQNNNAAQSNNQAANANSTLTAGKSNNAASSKYDPLAKEAQIRLQRKTRQVDYELKYIENLVELEKNVRELEGAEMKDKMWDDRYEWWIEQKEKTGKYPENFNQFYREREGIVLPEKKKKKKKKGDGKDSAADKAAAKAQKEKEKAAKAARENTKQGQKKLEEERKAKMEASLKTMIGPSHLVNHMYECISKYQTVWANLDESENYSQAHSEEIAKNKLRPIIREKIKKEVDVRLLSYLENIRLKVAQRAAAKKGKKGKKGKGKKGKKGKKGGSSKKKKSAGEEGGEDGGEAGDDDKKEKEEGDAASARPDAGGGGKKKKTSKKKKKGSKKKKKTKKCCEGEKSCAHMPLGDMISLLVKMGILQELRKPHKAMSDYLGDFHWLGHEYESAGVPLDASMQQMRSVLTESYILPLGSVYVKEQAPLANTLLLYGPHGSGKTLLSKAIACETNACWFDLSPRNVDRKLGTKAEIAKLIHMVFKVAEELQPSVVYIDEIEKLFVATKNKKNVSDLVKMKNFIMTHKSMLTRNVRVLVIGNSRTPYDLKVDKKELNRFFGFHYFGKMLFCPCPNYHTRLKLWKHFIIQTGLNWNNLEKNDKFDLTTLSYISEGYSAGAILQAVQSTIPPRRVQKLLESGRALDSSEFITALSKTSYTYKNEYVSYQKFTEEVTGEKERKRLQELQEQKEKEEKEGGKKKGGNLTAKKKKPAA